MTAIEIGKAGERELANLLNKLVSDCAVELGVPAPKPLMSRNLSQTRDGGFDILAFEFAVEVKRQETLAIDKWWAQTIASAGEKYIPVLIYRQKHKQWRVVTLAYFELHSDPIQFEKFRCEISFEEWTPIFKSMAKKHLRNL